MGDTLGESSLAISYKMVYFCIVPAGYYTCKVSSAPVLHEMTFRAAGLSPLQCDLCNLFIPQINPQFVFSELVDRSVRWHRREFTAILIDFALCFSTFTISYSYLLTNFIICHGPVGLLSTLVKEAFYSSGQW